MIKKSSICLLIIIYSFIFTSCGNFSSAESFLRDVYSKPVTLTKSNVAEDNLTENISMEKMEDSNLNEISDKPESHTIIEGVPKETTVLNETAETENDIKIKEEQSVAKYIITENGKKFHMNNCRTIKSIKQYISYDEAAMLGYEPCKICNPVND